MFCTQQSQIDLKNNLKMIEKQRNVVYLIIFLIIYVCFLDITTVYLDLPCGELGRNCSLCDWALQRYLFQQCWAKANRETGD